MENIETFNTIAGFILADLYEHFPVPKDLHAFEYASKAGLVSDPDYVEPTEEGPAVAAIEWLIEEGFIRTGSSNVGDSLVPHCVLTHRGLQLLSLPESLEKQESVGSQISKAAKSGALEGVKSLAKSIMCEGSKLAFQATIQAAMRP